MVTPEMLETCSREAVFWILHSWGCIAARFMGVNGEKKQETLVMFWGSNIHKVHMLLVSVVQNACKFPMVWKTTFLFDSFTQLHYN